MRRRSPRWGVTQRASRPRPASGFDTVRDVSFRKWNSVVLQLNLGKSWTRARSLHSGALCCFCNKAPSEARAPALHSYIST
jgi:hypothetical protein